ncbi:hypothetical protein Csa_010092 [Cucumis sativus]|uniref:Uncharacterized protein n=1 Tax=Cucumis sativus TaxID=3659 RepID=A0A0A0L8T0_CUCSA|nr:hypothetical protein Csa_010092 [Cucumis sativus]
MGTPAHPSWAQAPPSRNEACENSLWAEKPYVSNLGLEDPFPICKFGRKSPATAPSRSPPCLPFISRCHFSNSQN